MKKIAIVLIFTLWSNLALADCDWTKIKKLPDNGYEYSPELNLCVGRLVEDSKVKDQQLADLSKALSLKDLAIKDSDARGNMWLLTATNEQERLVKIDSDQKMNNILFFTLGVVMTGFAIYGASKALGR